MKKTITLVTLSFLLLLISPLRSQIYFQEDFESGFEPNGWITDPGWMVGTSAELSSQFFDIPAHTRFAGINDDGAGEGVSSVGAIISPQIDLEGADVVLLTFDCYFIDGDYDADETAKVLISTDSMASWTELLDISGANQWRSMAILLGEDYSGHKIHLAFAYNDGDGWNYGFCVDNIKVETAPDYRAEVRFAMEAPYTVLTPNQLRPLLFVHDFQNQGTQEIDSIRLIIIALLNLSPVYRDTQYLASIAPREALSDTFLYQPSTLGRYTFQFLSSHPELGDNFYLKTLLNTFEVSETVMAKDDGQRNVSIGMSFGDPSWHGYYGSEFDLINNDTLVGISVFMTTSTAGSFNLLVNVKDSSGLPTVELFHSDPIPINAGFNNWVYFPLPSPLPLSSGNYVFAVGQDTIQGIMGHGFDTDRPNPGYWIMSPVAGGGYPWTNYPTGYNPTLMIRPRFQVQQLVSTGAEPIEANDLHLYPNPFTGELTVHLRRESERPLPIHIFDLAGRQVFAGLAQGNAPTTFNLENLPPGMYLVRAFEGKKVFVQKVIKR